MNWLGQVQWLEYTKCWLPDISSLQALLMAAQGVLCLVQAWQNEFYLRS
jgi:hypothetical protein